MRLVSIMIHGFRGYEAPFEVHIDHQFTALIGKNDAGKSSIIDALDHFFAGSKIPENDFNAKCSAVVVSCTFTSLPEEIVIDSEVTTSLEAEQLVNSGGLLELTCTWRSPSSAPSTAARATHPWWTNRDDIELPLIAAKNADLKRLATESGLEPSSYDARVNSSIRAALRANADLRVQNALVPLDSDDGKKIASEVRKALPRLEIFRSDREANSNDAVAQSPAKAILGEVLREFDDELSAVASRVSERMGKLLEGVTGFLDQVSPDLGQTVLRGADLTPAWSKAFPNFDFQDSDGVALDRRGTGMRRLVLLSFFQARLNMESHAAGKTIVCIEEPETSLHPNLQRDLFASLLQMGTLDDYQVVTTTHSPDLLRSAPARTLRVIDRIVSPNEAIFGTAEDSRLLLKSLYGSLGNFIDHAVECFVVVEGPNDIATLDGLTHELSLIQGSGIRSFKDLSAEGKLCYISAGGGGSLALWQDALSKFNRYEVRILDSDRESSGAGLKTEVKNARKNHSEVKPVYVLERREMENYLCADDLFREYQDSNFEAEFTSLVGTADWNYLDIPTLTAHAQYLASNPEGVWSDLEDKPRKTREGTAKKRLARIFSAPEVARRLANLEQCDLLEYLRTVSRFCA